MIGRIVGSVLLTAFGLYALASSLGTLGTFPHTFIGKQEFSTMEEMQSFQSDLVSKVEEAGGSVQSFDLTALSPPKVFFNIYIPSVYEFEYGEQLFSVLLVTVFQATTIIVFVFMLSIANWSIWHTVYGSNMTEESE